MNAILLLGVVSTAFVSVSSEEVCDHNDVSYCYKIRHPFEYRFGNRSIDQPDCCEQCKQSSFEDSETGIRCVAWNLIRTRIRWYCIFIVLSSNKPARSMLPKPQRMRQRWECETSGYIKTEVQTTTPPPKYCRPNKGKCQPFRTSKLANQNISTEDACCQLCLDDPDCIAYQSAPSINLCINTQSTDRSTAMCVSGEVLRH